MKEQKKLKSLDLNEVEMPQDELKQILGGFSDLLDTVYRCGDSCQPGCTYGGKNTR